PGQCLRSPKDVRLECAPHAIAFESRSARTVCQFRVSHSRGWALMEIAGTDPNSTAKRTQGTTDHRAGAQPQRFPNRLRALDPGLRPPDSGLRPLYPRPNRFVELDVPLDLFGQGDFALDVVGRNAFPVLEGEVHQEGDQIAAGGVELIQKGIQIVRN